MLVAMVDSRTLLKWTLVGKGRTEAAAERQVGRASIGLGVGAVVTAVVGLIVRRLRAGLSLANGFEKKVR